MGGRRGLTGEMERQRRWQQGPRSHICDGVKGPVCCGCGCECEEGHTSRGKVKNPEKNKRLVCAVTSGLSHLEELLVSTSLFLFLHGALKVLHVTCAAVIIVFRF